MPQITDPDRPAVALAAGWAIPANRTYAPIHWWCPDGHAACDAAAGLTTYTGPKLVYPPSVEEVCPACFSAVTHARSIVGGPDA